MQFINSNDINLYDGKVCCIYIITNKLDGKVYIGQTTNFRSRLSDYQNIQNKKGNQQILKKAVIAYGTDNFTIDILETCEPDKLDELELYYIKKYQSYEKDLGYNSPALTKNTGNNDKSRKNKSIGHIGLKASKETKMKKSNMVLAIKDGTLIVAYGAKFFGDYIGYKKDMVKNALRQPSRIAGYRVYYDDFYKRQEIREKMMQKRSIRNTEYMDVLNALDMIEVEGVETMDLYFDKVYILVEDKDSESGFRLDDYTIEEELDDYSVDDFDYPIMEDSEEEPVDIFDYF